MEEEVNIRIASMNIICPKCKSDNIISITYGYPSLETREAAEREEILLGGCEVVDGFSQPDKHCKHCGFSWSIDRLTSPDIKKVRFRYWSNWGYYDPESMQEDQWAYDIVYDGTIKYCAYPRNSRRVLDKETVHIDKARVKKFYDDLLYWFKPWSYATDAMVCDGCSYELTILYVNGQQKKKQGDVAGGSIDDCIMKFLCTVPEMKKTLDDGWDK